MSNTTTAAFGRSINTLRAKVAMAAMAMTLAAVQPAEATNNGVSEKRVRAIVKQEVAKIPRGPRGPAGPPGAPGATGPAGMDGFPSLFALVESDGTVREGTASGITQENVRLEEAVFPDGQVDIKYCFTGLPPVSGGQLTMASRGVSPSGEIVFSPTPNLILNDDQVDCPTAVLISGPDRSFQPLAGSFYILLY